MMKYSTTKWKHHRISLIVVPLVWNIKVRIEQKKEKKELTKRRRYDKLNTPLRLKKRHRDRREKEKRKKLKKDVDKAKTRW